VKLALGALYLAALLLPAGAASAQPCKYRREGKVLLPDARCTPGAVRADATRFQLCAPGFTTKAYRHTDEATKRKACEEYGAKNCPGPEFEIDHEISLELGGSDELANLWPQPAEPRPGFHEKDQLENWLHRQVCSGIMPLENAQQAIAHDWYHAYEQMLRSESQQRAY
jgi:hypothetical protein